MDHKKKQDEAFIQAIGYQEVLEVVVKNMLKDRLPLFTIARYTELSCHNLAELKKKYEKVVESTENKQVKFETKESPLK